MFLWTWGSIQCSLGFTGRELSSIFFLLAVNANLQDIHLGWNAPTGNTFLHNVLHGILLSLMSRHMQCSFWKHCDTIWKSMSENKWLLSCHLLFTKVLTFSGEVFLAVSVLRVYLSTDLSFNELFLSAFAQKTWFSIYNTSHFCFYVFQWKAEKVIWISQGFPKLSCKEYQLLLSRGFLPSQMFEISLGRPFP